LLAGCGKTGVCVTGASRACACPDSRQGAQVCQDNGTYSTCHCDVAGLDAGSEPADAAETKDAGPVGSDGGASSSDAGVGGPDTGPRVIPVTCTGPQAPVRVNTQITIDCVIDAAGATLSTPALSGMPSDGVVLANATQPGKFYFALSTGAPGYSHPRTYQDTSYTITLEVHDVAKPDDTGHGSVKIDVLGNYWIGDAASNGGGVYLFGSDGKYLGPAVAKEDMTGISSLLLLPNGDIAVSSDGTKLIKVFSRQGVARPITFATTDALAGGKPIWDSGGSGFTEAGPNQMAISSTGELWVAGAFESLAQPTYGLAVFDLTSGALLRFVPHPEAATDNFKFTSLARRTDGKVAASSDNRRRICLFDELTYASEGCFTVGEAFSGDFKTLLAWDDGQLLVGIKESTDAGLLLLGPSLGMNLISEKIYYPDVTGLVRSGDEVLALGVHGYTCCDPQVAHFDATTLKVKGANWHLDVPGGSFYNPAGIVRLVPLP
jgi:sugar lactone lactonase YvrE